MNIALRTSKPRCDLSAADAHSHAAPGGSWARVFALCLLSLVHGCGLWMDSNDKLERAQEARAEGDVRTALIQLKDLLQSSPDMFEARFELGEISLEVGDVPSAIRELELAYKGGIDRRKVVPPLVRAYLADQKPAEALRVLDENPQLQSEAVFLALKGTALLELERNSEAHQLFSKAIEADPQSVDAILGLASVVARVEGLAPALTVTDRAIALLPEHPRIYLARGALRLQAHDYEAAEAEFRLAAQYASKKSNPVELLAALAGLTDAHLARGKVDLALASTAQMQQLAPNNTVSRYLRARALFMNGQVDEARPLLEQNLSHTPNHHLSRLLLGALMLARGDLGQAEMYLAAVVAVEPDNVSARQMLAEARLRQQKPEDALDALVPMLDTPDASSQLFALAGRASLAAGATATGLQYLERGATQPDAGASALLELAAGYISTGQVDRARAVLDSMPEDELAAPRRAYLTVLTHLSENDTKGAVQFAIAGADANRTSTEAQTLAGSLLAQLGRFEQADIFLQRARELEPRAPSVYVDLGRLATMRGDAAKAREYFGEALKLEEGHPGASLALAFLYVSEGESNRALQVLSQLRARHPKLLEGRVLETQILMGLGDLDQALTMARALVRDAPDRAISHIAYGKALAADGQLEESIKALDAAARRLPKAVLIRYELARALAADRQIQKAKVAAQAVLDVDPRHAGAKELLSRLAHAEGNAAEAREIAAELVNLAPDQANAHLLSGDLAFARKDFTEAAASYRKASTLTRDPIAAWKEFTARRQGSLANPLEPLQREVAQRPKDLGALMALADAEQQSGMPLRAIASYERVLQQSPNHPAALNNLAWLQHEQGDAVKALDLAERAFRAAPKRPEIADTYAWILVERGRVRQGLDLLAGIADDDAAPEIRFHYAVALARSGEMVQARAIAKSLADGNVPGVSARARELLDNLEEG